MAKIITVEIDEHGDSSIDLAGFHGKGCDVLQQAFTSAIGKSVLVEKKPEYNRPCQTTNVVKQGR